MYFQCKVKTYIASFRYNRRQRHSNVKILFDQPSLVTFDGLWANVLSLRDLCAITIKYRFLTTGDFK